MARKRRRPLTQALCWALSRARAECAEARRPLPCPPQGAKAKRNTHTQMNSCQLTRWELSRQMVWVEAVVEANGRAMKPGATSSFQTLNARSHWGILLKRREPIYRTCVGPSPAVPGPWQWAPWACSIPLPAPALRLGAACPHSFGLRCFS